MVVAGAGTKGEFEGDPIVEVLGLSEVGPDLEDERVGTGRQIAAEAGDAAVAAGLRVRQSLAVSTEADPQS